MRLQLNTMRRGWLASAAMLCTVLPLAAQAQDRPAPAAPAAPQASDDDALPDIVVTAQKRSERLVDVPISLAVLSSEDLQKQRIVSIDDLQRTVPGVASWSNGGTLRRVQIRGIGNASGASALIGLYLNEASTTSDASTQLDLRTYDLERIEVLRGPQGTLYGDGSVGGTIRFITRDPQLSAVAGEAAFGGGLTTGGGPSGRVEGMLNLPLSTDTLAIRVAGIFEHNGGYIDQPAAGKKNFNSQDIGDGRVTLLWKPAGGFTAKAMVVIHLNNGANNNRENASGNYTQVFGLTTTPSVQDDYNLYNLTLSYDFSGLQLLSTTSHIDQYQNAANYGARLGSLPPANPQTQLYEPAFTQKRHFTTQELRLTSTGTGPFNFTLGGFYRRYKSADNYPVIYLGLEGTAFASALKISSKRSTDSESWATFGDVSYELVKGLQIGAGARYFEDRQIFTDFVANSVQRGTFNAFSPRFYAKYRAAKDWNLYASVAKGFRSGGFNRLNQPKYGPETVWTYEFGSKLIAGGGRVHADIAVFHSDYTNYQVSGVPAGQVLVITSNAGNARINGIEGSLSFQAGQGFEFGVNGSVLDTKFTKVNATNSSYIAGDPIDLIPDYNFTVYGQYSTSIAGLKTELRVDYSQQGRSTFRNRSIGTFYFSRSDVLNLLGASISVDLSPRTSLRLYGQNLLNDRGYTDAAIINDVASRARPRTIGAELRTSF